MWTHTDLQGTFVKSKLRKQHTIILQKSNLSTTSRPITYNKIYRVLYVILSSQAPMLLNDNGKLWLEGHKLSYLIKDKER